jgi:hypothetical protein
MKAIRVVTCALAACAVAASAASIEQVLDINVTGAYQGISTNIHGNEHDRIQIFRINSANIVRSLAIDSGTNRDRFYTGTLIYKSALDGSTNYVVIRQKGGTNELDVSSNFVFYPGPFVYDQVSNSVKVTSRVETGFMGLSFTNSSSSFTNIGFSYGTSTRTHNPIGGRVDGIPTNGYANLLSYSGGSGFGWLNTNLYSYKTNRFTDTNFVSGPVQIQFRTFGPVFSPN